MRQLTLPLAVAALFFTAMALLWHSWAADMGSYLMTRNWVVGEDFTGRMPFHFRPPLIGVLLAPATALLGDTGGSKALAVLSLLLVAPATYQLARVWLTPQRAAVAATVALLHPFVFEHAIGGYGSFLSLAAGLVLIRAAIRPSPWSWAVVPASALVMAGMNQTVPVLIAVLLLFLVKEWRRQTVPLLAIGVLATAPWWPFAWVNVGQEGLYYGDHQWAPSLWVRPLRVLGFAATAGLFIFSKSPVRYAALAFATVTLFAIGNVAVNNAMGRAVLLEAVLCGVMVGGLVTDRDLRRRVGLALAAALLPVSTAVAWSIAGGLYVLTPDVERALRWVDANAPETAMIGGVPNGVGWWAGGLTGRAWGGTWPERVDAVPHVYKDEWADLQCVLSWGPCAGAPSRFDYLVIDWEGRTVASERQTMTEAGPLDLVYGTGSVRVYEVIK